MASNGICMNCKLTVLISSAVFYVDFFGRTKVFFFNRFDKVVTKRIRLQQKQVNIN